MLISIRNPHSVEAVLRTRPKDVQRIQLAGRGIHASWERVESLAKELKIPLSFGGGSEKDFRSIGRGPKGNPKNSNDDPGRQGGSHAMVQEKTGVPLEELFQGAASRKNGHGLWLALDQIQDPHNLGAIFRSAAFFGVQGIILTQERSAPLSNAVYDVASGGVEYVPFVVQPNLKQALDYAKKAGVWVLGTSEHASDTLNTVGKDRPWLVVLGNEETGLRRLTEESCDVLCRIPASGSIGSLNVAVSAGILISTLTG
ncbi:MAG: 23S rRNA (guanosine(2251)-2'-O)-methyltransferase RlmB [Bdellovibrio sp.]|nr:23S rRNA (guanosine(2251)-2'-O)-methyltransferase RlmB [Bdellovibrio sp.]